MKVKQLMNNAIVIYEFDLQALTTLLHKKLKTSSPENEKNLIESITTNIEENNGCLYFENNLVGTTEIFDID